MPIEKHSFALLPTLEPGVERVLGNINLQRTRTLTVTVRVRYDPGATAGVRVNLYYSVDGDLYDTVPYTYYDVNFSAGETVQETKIIDAPEEGFLEVRVKNLDTAQVARNIDFWYTIAKWEDK